MDDQAYVECEFPLPWSEHSRAQDYQTSLFSKQQSSFVQDHGLYKHYYKFPDQSANQREEIVIIRDKTATEGSFHIGIIRDQVEQVNVEQCC